MTIIILLIIIIISYIYILYIDNQLYNNFLTGFYKGESSYCKEAGIDEIVLYINQLSKTGHIIIKQNNELIEHTSFKFNKSIIFNTNNIIPFNNVLGSQYYEYNINFIVDNNDNFCWNKNPYKLVISIINGTITLLKDNIIHAVLYKDNGISNEFIKYAIDD